MKLFIFAGELSGDTHGGSLLQALKGRIPQLSVSGVAGPALRAQGVESVLPMEAFSVMGLSDVLWSLPRLWRHFNCIRDHILNVQPEVVVFIDSPSFSLRMAKTLRKHGFKGKIVQYICPTVWAWGKHRIQRLVNAFDLLLTIYPFEAQYFAHTPLRVQYVGNPVQEMISRRQYDPNWRASFGVQPQNQLLALFPGSRLGEIKRNLPLQLEAAKLLQKQYPEISILISNAQEQNTQLIQELTADKRLKLDREAFLIPKEHSFDLMRSCRSAIAKSGTVTLELALHQCPTVAMYQLSTLNRLYARHILRLDLPFYCIVNILGEKEIFPEFIDQSGSSQDLYDRLKPLYEEGNARNRCIADCQTIQSMFKTNDASSCAAQAIQETLKK